MLGKRGLNEVAQICIDALYLSRRQTTGVVVLRRGLKGDERTVQMCEDKQTLSTLVLSGRLCRAGRLNESVLPNSKLG